MGERGDGEGGRGGREWGRIKKERECMCGEKRDTYEGLCVCVCVCVCARVCV